MYPNADRTKFRFIEKVNCGQCIYWTYNRREIISTNDNIRKSFSDDLNPDTRARLYRDLGY